MPVVNNQPRSKLTGIGTVMKLDDDTFLVMPNVIRNFTTLDCARSVYWGTEQGAARGEHTSSLS